MSLVVGVDGGQSQIRLQSSGSEAVVAVDGLGRLEGDTSQQLVERVVEGWERLDLGATRVDRMVLGLTTLPDDQDGRDDLAAALGLALPVQEIWLTGDAVTAHAGALVDRDGVSLTVGTGVACFGVDRTSGNHQRVDGDGFLLGDGGGAFWIGSRGISAVLRSRDGRGEATSLAAACDARFGARPDLAAYLHSIPRAVNTIAHFAKDVQHAAEQGDDIAQAIVDDAAEELSIAAHAAARIVSRPIVPVAISGRAVSEGTPLRRAIARLISEATGLHLQDAAGTPLDGALRLARDADPSPYDRVMTRWSRS